MTLENEQGKADVYEYLDRCCQLISETYGKPVRADWTNSDYVRLSSILFRATKVQISPSTLKRIFGKVKIDSGYYPQKATRDALASYVGYSSWNQFVQAQKVADQTMPLQPQTPIAPLVPVPVLVSVAMHRRKWLLPVAVSALFVALLVGFFRLQPSNPAESAELVCRNPIGENPHSAVFEIRRPADNESATYRIQFGDGKRRQMGPTDSVYTHYYERPGRFFAILQRNDQNVDTATVYLQTKGWTVTGNMMHDTSRVYPIETQNLFIKGRHGISAQEAAHAGMDTNRTFFTEFINSQPTSIDGDNFELITHVHTSPDRAGVRCSQVGLTIWGESSQHQFDVMKPGCVHWIKLQTSEVLKSGQKDDLSFLGADLRAGATVKIAVVKRHIRIFINNRKVYEAQYHTPLGHVYGVKLNFSGIGTVDSFLLKDLRTDQRFNGNF